MAGARLVRGGVFARELSGEALGAGVLPHTTGMSYEDTAVSDGRINGHRIPLARSPGLHILAAVPSPPTRARTTRGMKARADPK